MPGAAVGASSSIFDLVIGFALGVRNDMGGCYCMLLWCEAHSAAWSRAEERM